jgi:hypothetical protein
MNDDLKITDDQLRLATSRTLPAGSALDAETSVSRDSFLALGSAVESAARNFDEATLLSRLTISREQTGSRSWINQYVWPLVATGALAAGMLLAVARIAMEHRQTNEPKTVARLPDNVAPAPTALVAPTTIAWNDSLDDEITLAAATIDQLLHTSRDFDGSLLRMNNRLEALSQELQGETL